MKDQFFVDYLERLENLQHRLHQAVRDLPSDAYLRFPDLPLKKGPNLYWKEFEGENQMYCL